MFPFESSLSEARAANFEVVLVHFHISESALVNAPGERDCTEVFDLEDAFVENLKQEGECEAEKQNRKRVCGEFETRGRVQSRKAKD